MTKKKLCTCAECRAAFDDFKEWLEEAQPLIEQLEHLGIPASEARIHLHLSEVMSAMRPQVLLVNSSSMSSGGMWN